MKRLAEVGQAMTKALPAPEPELMTILHVQDE